MFGFCFFVCSVIFMVSLVDGSGLDTGFRKEGFVLDNSKQKREIPNFSPKSPWKSNNFCPNEGSSNRTEPPLDPPLRWSIIVALPDHLYYCIKTGSWEWIFGWVFLSVWREAKYLDLNLSRSKFVIKCAAKILKIGWQIKHCVQKYFWIGNFAWKNKTQTSESSQNFPQDPKFQFLDYLPCPCILPIQNYFLV